MNPSDERRLLDALQAVREEVESTTTPVRNEANLLAAFRANKLRKLLKRNIVIAAYASATAASIWGVSAWIRLTEPLPGKPAIVARAPEAPALTAPQPAPPVRKARPVRRPEAVAASAVTDFVAVPYAPPFAPYDRGQLMRVRLPRQSLRSLGFPMVGDRWTERVQADVLTGEDGIARAIRFVK